MLSVCWGFEGIIHWKILSTDCTITADLYCQQLDRVAAKLKESRGEYTFYMTTPDHMLQSRHDKNDWTLGRLPFPIHLILQTWLLRTTICFVLLLIM